MKEIKAIIQPHMLNKVMQALHALPIFPGVTFSACHGQGRGRGEGGHYLATEDDIRFHDHTRLEIICVDNLCDTLVATIQQTAHTGKAGDGIIIVTDPLRTVRIRSGEDQHDDV